MTKTEHTPGPWFVSYTSNGHPYQIDAPNGRRRAGGIASVTRWGGISFPSSAEGKANARLIAAAPALLEALDWLLASVTADPSAERHPGDKDERLSLACAAAHAAILSATREG